MPYKGVVVKVLDQFEGGLRQSMGYVGCKTIESMQTETEFIEVTNAGMMESHVHDVMITKSSKLSKKLAYKKINFDKRLL